MVSKGVEVGVQFLGDTLNVLRTDNNRLNAVPILGTRVKP
jgi:hypothetical protein